LQNEGDKFSRPTTLAYVHFAALAGLDLNDRRWHFQALGCIFRAGLNGGPVAFQLQGCLPRRSALAARRSSLAVSEHYPGYQG
jgi:hypothetical protein